MTNTPDALCERLFGRFGVFYMARAAWAASNSTDKVDEVNETERKLRALIQQQRVEIERLSAALEWYAEQVAASEVGELEHWVVHDVGAARVRTMRTACGKDFRYPLKGTDYLKERVNCPACAAALQAVPAASGEPTEAMVKAGYDAAKKDGLTGPRKDCEQLVRLILTAALGKGEQ